VIDVAYWPIASFRGGAAIQSLSVQSGHNQTCRWVTPVAIDPKRSSIDLDQRDNVALSFFYQNK
jgi:hypothetical protein